MPEPTFYNPHAKSHQFSPIFSTKAARLRSPDRTVTVGVRKQLVVFDFDWSFVDQDTDRWVFEVLAPDIRRKMKTLKDDVQWTDLVAQSLRELHDRGGTRAQIEDALRMIPFHPAMVRTVSKLKATCCPETTFVCLSNANSVFIPTILESKGLQDLFDEVITNPAEWTPTGLLDVRRKVVPDGPQHDCKLGCSPNMCKGQELEAYLERKATCFDRIIYIGDGGNDYCPVVRLRRQDMVLCRSFRGLQKRIASEGGLKCQVQYWGGAWEVEEAMNKLIA